MGKEIKYNIETLNLLNHLSSISKTIVLEKGDDKIYIKRYNSAETITYHFEAPLEDFDYDGEELIVLDYPEFYQFLTAFKDPVIKLEENKLIISKDKSKLRYVLTDPESIQAGPDDFPEHIKYDCVSVLKADELKNIVKMIGLVGAENTNINYSDGKLTFVFSNEIVENDFEKSFECTSSNNEEFDFTIPAETFTTIPAGEYEISINSAGWIVFKLKHDRVLLRISTSAWRDDDE